MYKAQLECSEKDNHESVRNRVKMENNIRDVMSTCTAHAQSNRI